MTVQDFMNLVDRIAPFETQMESDNAGLLVGYARQQVNRILLALGRAQQAGSLLDHIALRDIRFDEQYVIIEFEPRTL